MIFVGKKTCNVSNEFYFFFSEADVSCLYFFALGFTLICMLIFLEAKMVTFCLPCRIFECVTFYSEEAVEHYA